MVCILVEERNYSEENLSKCTLSTTAGTWKVPGIEPEKTEINLHISKCLFSSQMEHCAAIRKKNGWIFLHKSFDDCETQKEYIYFVENVRKFNVSSGCTYTDN